MYPSSRWSFETSLTNVKTLLLLSLKNPTAINLPCRYCLKIKKTIPRNKEGHPRAGISASNRLHMEEISELRHRDLVAGLVTMKGKKTEILILYLDITKEAVPDYKGCRLLKTKKICNPNVLRLKSTQ